MKDNGDCFAVLETQFDRSVVTIVRRLKKLDVFEAELHPELSRHARRSRSSNSDNESDEDNHGSGSDVGSGEGSVEGEHDGDEPELRESRRAKRHRRKQEKRAKRHERKRRNREHRSAEDGGAADDGVGGDETKLSKSERRRLKKQLKRDRRHQKKEARRQRKLDRASSHGEKDASIDSLVVDEQPPALEADLNVEDTELVIVEDDIAMPNSIVAPIAVVGKFIAGDLEDDGGESINAKYVVIQQVSNI